MERMKRRARRRWALGDIEREMAVSYGLIAAVVVLGGIGYLLDRALGTSPWLLLGGLLAGLALGFYTLATLMKKR